MEKYCMKLSLRIILVKNTVLGYTTRDAEMNGIHCSQSIPIIMGKAGK